MRFVSPYMRCGIVISCAAFVCLDGPAHPRGGKYLSPRARPLRKQKGELYHEKASSGLRPGALHGVLCACGGGTPVPDESAPAEPPPASPTIVDSENEDPWAIAEDIIASGLTDDEVYTMYTNGEISDGVLYAWMDLAGVSPSGGPEAAEPEPEKLEGLIFAAEEWTLDPGLAQDHYAVRSFHPETGKESLISRFDLQVIMNGSDLYRPAKRDRMSRDIFSEDYSTIAVTKNFAGNGETHAGWMDTDGNFFDVTEALATLTPR